MTRRVFITGTGLVTPFGTGFAPVLSAVKSGRRAYGPLTGLDVSTLPVKVGGWISEEDIRIEGVPGNKLRGMGKYVKLGIMAAQEAVKSAGIDVKSVSPERMGAFIATGTHGQNAEGLFPAFAVSRTPDDRLDLKKLAVEGIDNVHPWWLLSTISNNLIFFVTHVLGIKGPNTNYCNTAVAGAYAFDCALESFHRGEIDIALVGGADSPLNWQILSDFSLLKFVAEGSPEDVLPLRPFGAGASGTILSDAAAFLVLETEEGMRRRGVQPIAELAACRMFSTNHGGIAPVATGLATERVLGPLVTDFPAGDWMLYPAGVGHPSWDQAEAAGIARAVDTLPGQGQMSCLKEWLGHGFSASFSLEVAIAAHLLKAQHTLPFSSGATLPLPAAVGFETKHQASVVLGHCFGGNAAGVRLHVV